MLEVIKYQLEPIHHDRLTTHSLTAKFNQLDSDIHC